MCQRWHWTPWSWMELNFWGSESTNVLFFDQNASRYYKYSCGRLSCCICAFIKSIRECSQLFLLRNASAAFSLNASLALVRKILNERGVSSVRYTSRKNIWESKIQPPLNFPRSLVYILRFFIMYWYLFVLLDERILFLSHCILFSGISKPVMKRLSESGFEDDLSFDAAPEDPATVVELYSALRKSPSTNNGMFEEPQGYAQRAQLMTEPSQDCILGVIPEQNEMTPRSNNSKCDPEYASPSSVCVQAACTTCGQGSESILQGNKLLDTSPRQQTVCVEPCSPQALAKTFGDDRGMVGGSQAFDNNSYEEVELKFYQERLAAQAEETHEPAKSALRRDSRLRRSQNHYVNVTPKQAETQRPSSLVLDLDSVQTAVQYFGDRCSERKSSAQGLSSPSNVEKTPLSPRQEQRTTGGSSERARQNKQSGFHEHAEVSKKKPPVSPRSPQTDMLPSWSDNRKSQDYMNVWMERTDSTSSQSDQQPFVTAGSGQPINLSNPGSAGGQRKSYSKIGFCDGKWQKYVISTLPRSWHHFTNNPWCVSVNLFSCFWTPLSFSPCILIFMSHNDKMIVALLPGFSQPQLSDLPPPPPPPPLTDNEEEPIDRQPPNPSDGEYLECSEAVSGIRDFGDSGR